MRIYLLNQDRLIQQTLINFLRKLGHDVIPFDSACSLLKAAQADSESIDLLLAESDEPWRNEDKLLKNFHEFFPSTPIILISDPLLSSSAVILVSQGVHAMLRKPVSLKELELLIIRISQDTNGASGNGSDSKHKRALGNFFPKKINVEEA